MTVSRESREMLGIVDQLRYNGLDEGVAKVLIRSHRARPNSYRLMNNPMTKSCIYSVLETPIRRLLSRGNTSPQGHSVFVQGLRNRLQEEIKGCVPGEALLPGIPHMHHNPLRRLSLMIAHPR